MITIGKAIKTRKDLHIDWWRGKKIQFFWEEIEGTEKRVEVEDCDRCYGGGSIITRATEKLDELDWDFEDCPKCDGTLLQVKRIAK